MLGGGGCTQAAQFERAQSAAARDRIASIKEGVGECATCLGGPRQIRDGEWRNRREAHR